MRILGSCRFHRESRFKQQIEIFKMYERVDIAGKANSDMLIPNMKAVLKYFSIENSLKKLLQKKNLT